MTQPTAEQLELARECAVTAAHSARFDDEILSFWVTAWSDRAKGIFEEGATQSALLAIQATEARAQGLVEALERVGSSEAIGIPFMMTDSNEAFELRERMEIARQALATWRRT